ncbi:vomeronasal type-2 receptor 1-like [Rhinoderma darwinii]|uniref:vomeronasal type-2 receptor 1-like n=1 Tax=Rhinoderma darwinii TaxID=43563 RepID=UPI003F662256
MGTICAPTYANLFLGWWEDTVVFTEELSPYTCHILFWGRFIDDILLLWDGDLTLFDKFMVTLNNNKVDMKFTHVIHKKEIMFLDLKISLHPAGGVHTDISRKLTSTNSLLHWKNHHPMALKKGISIGQYLRAKRNCSDERTFELECDGLFSKFRAREYPKKWLHKAYDRARATDRKELLYERKSADTRQLQTTFKSTVPTNIKCIGTFDAGSRQVREILQRYWPILLADPDLRDVVSHTPSITYRRVSHGNDVGCKLKSSNLSMIFETGELLIGAIIPFHTDHVPPTITFTEPPTQGICTWFLFETYQQFQALRFAVEEINRNPEVLPNVTLGFVAYDSCSVLNKELEGTLGMVTGREQAIPNYLWSGRPPMAAILGHSMSTYSILMAHVLGLYRYPQISHYATSALLSDRTQFPSFFRTVPSDTFQSQGLAQLVLNFGWTWVGLVAMGNDYGQQGIQVITQEILKAGACVAFTELILLNRADRNAPYITRIIKQSTAKAIIVFSIDVFFIPILDEMIKLKVTGKVIVASEAWSISSILLVDKYAPILSGTLGFAFYSSTIPGFKDYLKNTHPFRTPGKTVTRIFWEKTFGCKFFDHDNSSSNSSSRVCSGNETLTGVENAYTDVSNLRTSYNIYTSALVIAEALHNLQSCQEKKGPFHNRSCANPHNFTPWQLTHYVQNVRVRLKDGREVFFDNNGDPPAVYDIVNWQQGVNGVMKQVNVGKYNSAANSRDVLTLNSSAIQWIFRQEQVPTSACSKSCAPGFRKATLIGQPVCCYQCIPCPQGEISNQTDSLDCFRCPWDKWPNLQRNSCFPKTIEFLSFEEPLGATLAGSGVSSFTIPLFIFGIYLKQKDTPIIKANNYSLSCLLLVCLSFCFLSSLTFIGYPQSSKCFLRQAAFGMVFALCISCVLAKTIMVVFAFMATKPGSSLRKWATPRVSYGIIFGCSLLQFILCVSWMSISPPFPENDIQTHPGTVIAECNEGSSTAFWCMVGYLSLLAFISFLVAFLARRLPDSFNETKFITFSMLAFLSVWISFIPASISARGKYTVAMEVFAIIFSAWALVICMFLPKCFIILFRPDMNSREHLLGKLRNRT